MQIADGGLATMPPLSQFCLECHHEYSSFSERSRFCCDEHRIAYWKRERKIGALVAWLVDRFGMEENARRTVTEWVRQYFARFCRYAEELGYRYHTKKYVWQRRA